MRILIVEDDAILASVAAEILEEEGHEIVGPAYDLSSALRAADTGDFDVAFVDINLAGHDEGIYVSDYLLEKRGIYSLFISGQVLSAQSRRAGAIGLLSKPYSLEDLVNTASITQSWLADEGVSVPKPPSLTLFDARPSKQGSGHE